MARLRIRRMPPNTYQLLLNLTNRHIHVQLVDRQGGRVVLAAHTTEPKLREQIGSEPNKPGRYATASVQAAGLVGSLFAERANQAGISTVYWNSPGRYHGKIKAFIDAVRGGGIETKRAISKDMPANTALPGASEHIPKTTGRTNYSTRPSEAAQ